MHFSADTVNMVPEIVVKKRIGDRYTYKLGKICLEKNWYELQRFFI